MLAVLAALIKPQFGVVALPLVGIVLLRRHLFRPDDQPRNPVLLPAAHCAAGSSTSAARGASSRRPSCR